MPYKINHTDQAAFGSLSVADNSINTETSLSFIGKNYSGYANIIAENFLHLLENFASNTAPVNPVVGQLWYTPSTASTYPVLKIWDGVTWVASAGLQKSASPPSDSALPTGELWVDTTTQQLKLWNGTSWAIVGPQYSTGTKTGIEPVLVTDSFDNSHSVLKVFVENEPILILSKDATFTPKIGITGFATVNPGINVSSEAYSNGSLNKCWGTADSADSLIVANTKVAATNFLRSDVTSITNYPIIVSNNNGISIGVNSTTNIKTDSSTGNTVITNLISGRNISLVAKSETTTEFKTALSANATSVGIFTATPTATLDVTGNLKVSTGISCGSLATAGSIQVSGGLTVSSNSEFGTAITGTVTPKETDIYSLGSPLLKWNAIYVNSVHASNINGAFSGTFTGNITGSATRLASSTAFSINGEVQTTASLSFTGAEGVIELDTILNSTAITSKDVATLSNLDDTFLVYQGLNGLRQVSKRNLVKDVVPIGTIITYAISTPPVGYVECNGQTLSKAAYPELFAKIGYLFNTAYADADSVFAVPAITSPHALTYMMIYTGKL